MTISPFWHLTAVYMGISPDELGQSQQEILRRSAKYLVTGTRTMINYVHVRSM